MMILSSLSPLFIMLSFRGAGDVIPDLVLWIIAGAILIIPSLFIYLRTNLSIKHKEIFELATEGATQNKEYLFTYLFTILLPLYSLSITNTRELFAVLSAILFVMLILWNMNLHYINILFALLGYRVFVLKADDSKILISSKQHIERRTLKAHRLSNSVFIEVKNYDY